MNSSVPSPDAAARAVGVSPGEVKERAGAAEDPRYPAFFGLFNRGQYYEAHEVLEELWLPARGGPDGDFYKGLIQLAGAFVHLRRGRLRPAEALLARAEFHLAPYAPRHRRVEIAGVLRLIREWRQRLLRGEFRSEQLESPLSPRISRDESIRGSGDQPRD